MTAPVIRQFAGTIPDKGQAQTAFDTNVDAFLEWQALQFAPDLVAFGTFASSTAAALVAANLPSLTGNELDAVRVNAAADGVEFVDVTAAGWALLDDADAAAQRTTLGVAEDSADADLTVTPDGALRRDIGKAYVDGVVDARRTRETALTTSGAGTYGFTGIAAGANRITLTLHEVSLSGSDDVLIQIGDSGGYEATGYNNVSVIHIGGGNTLSTETTGFRIDFGSASNVVSGQLILTRIDGNIWAIGGTLAKTNPGHVISTQGSKSLSAELDRIQITTTGANTFDAGTVNIMVET